MRLIKKNQNFLQARMKNQKILSIIFFTKLKTIGSRTQKVKDFYEKTNCYLIILTNYFRKIGLPLIDADCKDQLR